MKFSEKWLREWVNPNLDIAALGQQLTMAGLEVESLQPAAGAFDQVIVGQIQQAEQHPKADRLRVCQVDIGNDHPLLNIVCGAPNARAGIKVAVAMIGATLPNGIVIQKTKLRDVLSEGMLCSTSELGINSPSEGILELPEDAPLGKDLREYLDLDDIIVELSITPNRGDCLSIAGISREIAALNHCAIHEPIISPVSENISETKSIHIEDFNHCGAYYGRVIKNVNANLPAPYWLSERVKRSGTRSISSIVDVTNYVLYELGQPLHAFDLDKLEGNITVRLSQDNEQLELLDGQTVTLKPGTLVIADESGPIAMAGIMGGLKTAVTEKTKHIFLESAWFSPTTIAGKARQYGISTDAAYRYERGVDPTLQQKALARATNLIINICGGDVGPEVASHNTTLSHQRDSLSLSSRSIERLLGISLSEDEKKNFTHSFNRLGLMVLSEKVSEGSTVWEIQIPAHRSDIRIEADLIEEAARIYGYQNIPTTPLHATLSAYTTPKIPTETFCDALASRGYHEIISYSFVNADKQARLYPDGKPLSLLNPISSEYTDMRKGLWPGLLEAAAYNQNRQNHDLRLFETGTRFSLHNQVNSVDDIEQKTLLAGLCVGERASLQWNEDKRSYDFYDIKGDVEALLSLSHLHSDIQFEPALHPALHPGQTAKINVKQSGTDEFKTVGWVGALHPQWIQPFNLIGNVFLFELDLDILSENSVPHYQKLSKFPSIRRDLSFIIDSSVSAQAVLDCIREQDETILQNAQVFDVYQGSSMAENQKSLAITLTLQHPERTLVELEVNTLMEKILGQLQLKFSILLRQ